MLSWLLACVGAAPAPEASPDPTAQVVVRSYREEDISKRDGHANVHAYATLVLARGDAALTDHAEAGRLQVNMARDRLAEVASLPWTPGQALSIRAQPTSSSPGYVVVSQAEPSPSPAAAPAPLEIVETWTGPIHLAHSELGSSPDTAPLLIRDDEAYDAFIASLPATRVQKKQPAPPSDDPMRQRPPIDFTEHMLVVALRDDMYDAPVITAARRDALGVHITIAHPGDGDLGMRARAMGVGTYHAVQLPRIEGPVQWTSTSAPPTP